MHKRSKAQQDVIIRFQQLGTFHTALTQLCKFTQPRGYPPCCVDGSHGHRSIIYIRILRCTPPTPTLSCDRVSSAVTARLVLTVPPIRSSKLLFLSICPFEIERKFSALLPDHSINKRD